MLMKGKIIFGLMALWLQPAAWTECRATDIVTAQSGSWTSSSTWVGGVVPVQGDQATIKNGHTITIPSSGTKTCTNLVVESGGKLYANTGGSQRYVDVYGNITCDGIIGNGTTADGISFNIEGASCLVSGSGAFDAARIRKNTSLNPSTILTIAMDMNLRYNGTALFNNKSATNFHVVINAGCTLNCPGNAGTPGNICIDGTNASNGSSYGGSVTVNGTMNVGGILYLTTDNNSTAYTVSFTISNGGLVNTGSVVCSNSGSAGHTTTIHDGGKLNFTSGDWGCPGFTYNYYYIYPASTVEFSGAAQNIGNPSSYGHLLISGTGEKTVSPGDLAVNGDLTIQSGCSLVIPQSRAVTLEGNLYNNTADGLVLKAGSASAAPGSFIQNGSVGGTGTVKVEKFISPYLSTNDPNYHFISSPVASQDIQPEFVCDPPESSTDFYRWDEPSAVWVNSKTSGGAWNTAFQPGDDRSFRPGIGYLVAYASDVVKSFSGLIRNSGLDAALTFTGGGDYAGYNLLGNPFTSAINADIHNWAKTNVQNAVWVWDPVTGNYKTWNGLTGTLDGGLIPAMQGFFVKASGPSPALTIPSSSRTHGNQPAYKSTGPLVLRISLAGHTYSDEAVLYIPRPLAGPPDSMFNVGKLMGFRDAPQLYFLDSQQLLSVLQADSMQGDRIFPMGIHKGSSDTLSFKFSGIESFSAEDAFYFEDRLEGRILDLRETVFYEFVSHQACENSRFYLHYKRAAGTSAQSLVNRVRMYVVKGELRIEGPDDIMDFEGLAVFDMGGRKVLERRVPPGVSRIPLNLAPAWYLVRLMTGKATITKKLLFFK